MKHNYEKRREKYLILILIGYFVFLTVVLVTRLNIVSAIIGMPVINIRSVNLIPFHTLEAEFKKQGLNAINTVGNTVMFMPIGIAICTFAKEHKFIKAIIGCFFITILVELLQYILRTGATDIDDIITNMVGGLTGVFLYYIFYRVCNRDSIRTKNIIAIAASIFVPFLLIYIYSMFFTSGRQTFSVGHMLILSTYFILINFIFNRDFSLKQNILFYLSVLGFGIFFFFVFL